MEMSARVIFSRSSGLFWLASQACIMTSSKAGSPSKTPTSSALLLPPCWRWGCDLGFLWASLALLDFLYFYFQWPIFWQEWQVESFAGQCSLPGVWHFVQLPQGLPCDDAFFVIFCTALTAFVDRPIEDMLFTIAMWVQHTASISAVVASIFIAKSFLIRSVLLRAWTIQNWMCLSFSTSVGKLHLLASPRIHSRSLSGVSPAFILISSSWYILHCWDTGWSMELCRNSIKSLALFLFFSHSSVVAPEGFHCSCFLHPMGPMKLSRYSSHVVSPALSGIPWSVYQLSIPLMKSRTFSNCSNEFQLKVGGFRESVREPLISVKALVRALMMAS